MKNPNKEGFANEPASDVIIFESVEYPLVLAGIGIISRGYECTCENWGTCLVQSMKRS